MFFNCLVIQMTLSGTSALLSFFLANKPVAHLFHMEENGENGNSWLSAMLLVCRSEAIVSLCLAFVIGYVLSRYIP